MISLGPSSALSAHLGQLADLTALLSDPQAAAKRISDLQMATAAAREALVAATKASAATRDERQRVDAEIKNARAVHESTLATQLAKFENDAARRTKALDAREQNVAKRESAVEAEAATVADLKADLQRRLAAVKAAVGEI